jgi:hypothetical protein
MGRLHAKSLYDRGCDWSMKFYWVVPRTTTSEDDDFGIFTVRTFRSKTSLCVRGAYCYPRCHRCQACDSIIFDSLDE